MPLSRSSARTDADVDRARHHNVPALRVKLETGPDAPGEARAAIATSSWSTTNHDAATFVLGWGRNYGVLRSCSSLGAGVGTCRDKRCERPTVSNAGFLEDVFEMVLDGP